MVTSLSSLYPFRITRNRKGKPLDESLGEAEEWEQSKRRRTIKNEFDSDDDYHQLKIIFLHFFFSEILTGGDFMYKDLYLTSQNRGLKEHGV